MDPSQAARVLQEYGTAVLHLAYSYLRSREEAEDVLQDTLVQYIRKAPDFDSQAHERAWLLRVAANLSKNRLKAPWHWQPPIPEDYPAQGIPEESVALYQAVSALPVKYREVIHLYYYEDATTAQIAAILGKREGTVRSLLTRARAQLRASLKGGDADEALSKRI